MAFTHVSARTLVAALLLACAVYVPPRGPAAARRSPVAFRVLTLTRAPAPPRLPALGSAQSAGTVPYFIAQTPDIVTGLLLGLVLLLFLGVGLSCVAGISAPDQLFEKDQALPAGKEY